MIATYLTPEQLETLAAFGSEHSTAWSDSDYSGLETLCDLALSGDAAAETALISWLDGDEHLAAQLEVSRIRPIVDVALSEAA